MAEQTRVTTRSGLGRRCERCNSNKKSIATITLLRWMMLKNQQGVVVQGAGAGGGAGCEVLVVGGRWWVVGGG